jgi:hypothetical protein
VPKETCVTNKRVPKETFVTNKRVPKETFVTNKNNDDDQPQIYTVKKAL